MKLLRKLQIVALKAQAIPSEWSKAVNTKNTPNSCNINQFRGITLLNLEEKLIFSVMVKRVTENWETHQICL